MGKEGKEEFCNKCLFENFSHVTFLLIDSALDDATFLKGASFRAVARASQISIL